MHVPTRLIFALSLAATAVSTTAARSADPDVDARELPRVAATEPNDALSTFRVQPGFHLELAAAEPLIADPVTLAFDENGLLYVVEMRGYSERREDKLGRIKRLADTDHDGRYDEATVFADGLAWPTAVACWDGGVFVGATPDIWYFKDHDGDGVAEEKRVAFTGFAQGVDRLNVQAMLNSFQWGPDQRIHGATSFNGGRVTAVGVKDAPPVDLRGRDFSFDPRTLDIRPESGGGQHGMSFDDAGRKFACSNSRHLMQIMYEDRVASRQDLYSMPAPAVDIAVDGPAAEVFRISPDEPWRIVRTRWRIAGLVGGPVEGGGRVSGYFTGASGAAIYRGHAWPEAFRGDAFIGDVGGNLVHHKRLSLDGLVAKAQRPADELDHEFLASTDNWFRPVQFANAPDGCLYIADMYREVIEHPWSLPPAIKQHLDLNSGNERGRIWRIAPDGFESPPPPNLGAMSTEALVRTLEHSNGWHRDTAARLLHQRHDKSAISPLTRLLASSGSALARWHALQVLDGMSALETEHWRGTLRDENETVRALAVRLAGREFAREGLTQSNALSELCELAGDDSPMVRYELALALGDAPERRALDALGRLIRRDAGEVWMQAAVLNSIACFKGENDALTGESILLPTLTGDESFASSESGRTFLRRLATMVGTRRDIAAIRTLLEWLASRKDLEPAATIVTGLAEGLNRAGSNLSEVDRDDLLKPFFESVTGRIMDPSAPETERVQAMRLAGLRTDAGLRRTLWQTILGDEAMAIRRAAWESWRGNPGTDAVRQVIGHWAELPEFVRRDSLDMLIGSDAGALETLDAVRTGTVSEEWFTASQKERLRHHRNEDVRRTAVGLFGAVQTVEARLQELRPALQLRGLAEAGRTIYVERCASCHRLGDEGHDLGPDLATVKDGGPEKILLSLLDPNREVAPNYVQYDIETKDGETLSGIIVSENTAGLTVRQANGVETFLVRSQVAGMRSTGRSPMPEGLTEGLTAQQVADLLAFVLK